MLNIYFQIFRPFTLALRATSSQKNSLNTQNDKKKETSKKKIQKFQNTFNEN